MRGRRHDRLLFHIGFRPRVERQPIHILDNLENIERQRLQT